MKAYVRLVMLGIALVGLTAIVAAQDAASPQPANPASAPSAVTESPSGEMPAGDAVATLLDKLRSGGTTVVIQVLLSIIGLAFAVERFVNLRRGTIAPVGLFRKVDALWSQGRIDDVQAACDRHPSTLARMIRALIDHRNGPAGDAATVAGDIGARELKLHLQRAYPIAVVATIEPLLGLFGTVWGMILAFDKIALMGSMGNAAALSSEISLALVTTAVGLAIAIPMLLLYHYFKGRTSLLGITLEEQVNELISRHVMRRRGAEVTHAD